MRFNFNSTEPLYLQVANQIEEAIFTQVFRENEQIPSTTEISQNFHINPATILKGMNILVDANLLEKRRGLGIFVKPGAYELLLHKRQEAFYQEYVVKLIKEAKKLNMKPEEISALIVRGIKEDE